MKYLLAPILILIFACQTFALGIPEPKGYVNDLANVLSNEQEQALEVKMSDWEKQTSNEFSILAINSLEGENITDYSFKVAEKWGIGKADKDNGMLLLISLKDREWWIQIGEGLEGIMPDGKAGLILDKTLPQYFRAGNFYGGLNEASTKIMQGVGAEYMAASPISSVAQPSNTQAGPSDALVVFVIIVICIVIIGMIIFLTIVFREDAVGSGYTYRPSKPYMPPRSTTTYLPPITKRSSKSKKKSVSSSSVTYMPTPTYYKPKKSSSRYGGSYGGSYGGGSFGGSFGSFGGGSFSGGGAGGKW